MADKSKASYWAGQIEEVKKNEHYTKWLKIGEELSRRFSGIRFSTDVNATTNVVKKSKIDDVGYNLLFRNIKIRMPYLLPYIPQIVVEREKEGGQAAERIAAQIIEGLANKMVEKEELNHLLDLTKLVTEIYGLGTVWIRYEPVFETVTREIEDVDEFGRPVILEQTEELLSEEHLRFDFVHPKDLLFNTAKTTCDIDWISRKLTMDRTELQKTFPKLNMTDFNLSKENDKEVGKVEVYEIWDKGERKIYFYIPAKDHAQDMIADIREYPWDIDFPCPMPLAFDDYDETTMSISRHGQFLSQYRQVDDISTAIKRLAPTIRIKGLYDSQLPNLEKAFSSDNENSMIGVKVPDQIRANGGRFEDMFLIFDNAKAVGVLLSLIKIRDQMIQDIQQGIGVVGIMESQTNVQEAFGTNRIKGSFGTMWIQEDQRRVATFVERLSRLAMDIAAQQFTPESMISQSGVDLMNESQEDVDAAIGIINDNRLRGLSVYVATEDTKAYTDSSYKSELLEAGTTLFGNLKAAAEICSLDPAFAELCKIYTMQILRAQRGGRSFESSAEKAIDKVIQNMQAKEAQPPEPPQPSPDAKVSAEARIQSETIRQKAETDRAVIKVQEEDRRAAEKGIVEEQKIALKNKELDFEMALKQADQALGNDTSTNIGLSGM